MIAEPVTENLTEELHSANEPDKRRDRLVPHDQKVPANSFFILFYFFYGDDKERGGETGIARRLLPIGNQAHNRAKGGW